MNQLLRSIKEYFFYDWDAEILILGMKHSGKRTLLNLLNKGTIVPQLLDQFPRSEMVCIDNLTFRTMDIDNPIWQDMWSRHVKRANAIIFLVDCSSRDLNSILEEFKTVVGDSRLKKLPILLIGTKIDIPNALSVGDLERLFVCKCRPFKICVTNLLTRQGYTDGFTWLSDVIFKKNTDQ